MSNFKFFKHSSDVKSPQRGTPLSSGIDFFSPVDFTIPPRGDILVDLQISVLIEPGYDLLMENKSGVSTKLKLIRGACLVDSDYTYPNKIHVHLFNLSDSEVQIKKDQKIIQGVIRKIELWSVEEITDPELMKREGERIGGFGSTGS